jgi:hypothetical protein
MRTPRVPLLVSFAFLLSAGVAWPCGGYGLDEPPAPLPLPGSIARAVLRGDQLHAVSTEGHLFTVDLRKNTVRTLHNFNIRMAPVLDLAGDRACVAANNHVYLVDLKDGRVLCSKDLASPIHDAGFLGDRRVYVISGSKLSLVDLAGDKPAQVIDLGKTPRDVSRAAVTGEGEAKRLLVPMAAEKTVLAVIDPEKGKVIDQVPMPGMALGGIYSAGDLQVAGDRAFIVCWRFSYGVWTQSFGCVDLKERKFTLLKLPSAIMHERRLALGTDGQLFLAGEEGTHQYDAQGKLVGPVFARGEGRLVGMWRRQALLVKGKELQRSALPRVTARAE